MATEKTLALIKPSVNFDYTNRIISTLLLNEGFEIFGRRRIREGFHSIYFENSWKATSREQIFTSFYNVHKNSKFYKGLVNFMILYNPPVDVLMLVRDNAVEYLHKLKGEDYDSSKCSNDTIRGILKNLSNTTPDNFIHCSDSAIAANSELTLFFGPDYKDLGQ